MKKVINNLMYEKVSARISQRKAVISGDTEKEDEMIEYVKQIDKAIKILNEEENSRPKEGEIKP